MSQLAFDPFAPWTQRPLACFDTETTDPIPTEARVVTAYVATIDGAEVAANEWLLNPECEIPEGAAKIHGVTTERAQAEGSDYHDGILSIWAALQLAWADGRVVVAFNAAYDITVMVCELRRLGVEPGEIGPLVDPFVIDRHYDKYRKGSRKLDATCAHYKVKLGDAHQADADALAAARLAWKLPRVYPQLRQWTPDQLMAEQEVWYRDRQLNFIDYLKRNNKPYDDVSTSWPLQLDRRAPAA